MDIYKHLFVILTLLACCNKALSQGTQDSILKKELDSIRVMDQQYRMMADSIGQKFGVNSKEYQNTLAKMSETDSSNSKRIREIINEYGWPGKSLVGDTGNITVFLVIQHSDISVQIFYLPLLKESVIKGESRGKDLAYLEDRIAIRTGKKQKYGTQLTRDKLTGIYYVSPLENPDNVDKRRKEIGLGPIAEYLKSGWGIGWNLEKFKQEQAEREKNNK